jgi:hypothetical protein
MGAVIDLRHLADDENVEIPCYSFVKNSEITAEILRAVSIGASLEQAAHAAGISARTLFYWLRRGKEKQSEEYVAFRRMVYQARARGMNTLTGRIFQASVGDWKAGKYILSCRSKEWVEKDKLVNTNAEIKALLKIAKETLSEEELEKFLHAIAEHEE